jgi:hypothetical protein
MMWQMMTGEPVLELCRIEQDHWYAKLEDEAEKNKPTQTPQQMIAGANGR